ncbi:hypothetical protein [Halosolutus halophilus]|uniref:hypothetical protein n=1 Tax=Halosolutus halophilus TaxID=1552990 RepID=UPI00223514AC|nr:hypothetical protein [Halosolutus halophilus]
MDAVVGNPETESNPIEDHSTRSRAPADPARYCTRRRPGGIRTVDWVVRVKSEPPSVRISGCMREWADTDCPTCGTPLRVGMPQDANVFGITDSPDPALEAETESNAQRRCLTARCPEGHLAHVYYGF